MARIKSLAVSELYSIYIIVSLTACNPDANHSHKTTHTMFTIDQIQAAHSKVKSGADFPAYVQDLIQLGVSGYETYVSDGHTVYYGKNPFSIRSGAKYEALLIAGQSNKAQFLKDLNAHQQGKTSFPVFCNDCAKSGIEKWIVDMNKMTCTYYDKAGEEMLVETIPMP